MNIKRVYNVIFHPNFNSIFLCRIALRLHNKGFKFISRHLKHRIFFKYGIHLGLGSELGDNLKFPHPQGIIIGEGSVIGKDCTIYHQVTLGKKNGNLNLEENDYPKIGNNVTIFAGAKIFGNVYIGDNSVIAANSVVLCNVDSNSVYAGIPAKKIKNRL